MSPGSRRERSRLPPREADPAEGAAMTRGGVVVTGASTGIGHACALHLDRLGFHVFAGVRRDEDAERLRSEGSDRLTPVKLDVTDSESIREAADQVKAAL